MSGVCCYGIEQPMLILAVQTLESFAVNLLDLLFLKVMFSLQFLLKICPYIQEYLYFGFCWDYLFLI